MTLVSGPPREDLPYRFWCPCGGVWNSDEPEVPTTYCTPTTRCALRPFKENENVDSG